MEDFVVGVEKCDPNQVLLLLYSTVLLHTKGPCKFRLCLPNQAGYCNGPLKPGTPYRFKIRAYTTRDKHAETEWSTAAVTDPDHTAKIVGIIIPIVLIIIVVILVLAARR